MTSSPNRASSLLWGQLLGHNQTECELYWLRLVNYIIPGAGPPVRLGAISVTFDSQVLLRVHYCTAGETKYTSQHCCDKTIVDKMALSW